MATVKLKHEDVAGEDIYFRLFNESWQVFDFDDNTFKALGAATTPEVAATEVASASGTGRSGYHAAIDLADVNPFPAPLRLHFAAYNNGTPAVGDLPVSDFGEFVAQCGEVGEQPITAMCEACFTSSMGTAIRFSAWLERGGQRLTLGSGSPSCTIAVRENTAGSDLFSVTDAAPTAEGIFEASQSSPGFTDDRLYLATVAITVNGVVYTTVHPLQVQAT